MSEHYPMPRYGDICRPPPRKPSAPKDPTPRLAWPFRVEPKPAGGA